VIIFLLYPCEKFIQGGLIMHRSKIFLWVLGLVLAAFFLVPVQEVLSQESADELYEAAVFKKEAEGDLEGAIQIFLKVIAKFPENRKVAAKAQLQIGTCYEKLGMQEAQKAFQSVIDKYPEQTQEVALAKERLARIVKALAEETHKPSFRKIRIPANPGNGVLSPDGKLLAFTSQGSVWVVPISGKVQPDLAGEPVRLTEPMGAWNMGNIMAWSDDGQWIAFNQRDDKDVVIYVVSASGGKPKKIPVKLYRGNHVYNYRVSLSADGKTLAFCSGDITTSKIDPEKDEPLLLYAIPVDGGEARRLTDAGAAEPAFSPDGKRIAFTRPYFLENGKAQKDLWVTNSDGSKPTKVTEFPGRARGPVWSPDGKMIAFHYEPGGSNFSNEIWIVAAPVDQKPAGAPITIKLPSESLSMIAGWTTDNKIGLLLTNPLHQAVYTVPAGGGKATQVSPETATRFTGNEDFEGYPCHPRWSPDGKTIYFRWGKGHIVSVPSQGGNLFPVHSSKDTQLIEALPGGGNDVSPDGKKIVFAGAKEGVRPLEVNIWTVPAEGGKPKQITKSPSQDRYPCWSPDGKRIAFIRYTEKSKDDYVMNIYVVPAEGGEVRQITTEADRVNYASIKWAPDGNQIAYFSLDKTINVKSLQGGASRVLVNVENVHSHCELSWSPDGKELAYTSKGRIMVVSLGGGEPREIKTGILNEEVENFHIDWSPDGKKFAFTAGFGGDEELWLMEDFLPPRKEK
jgi:Tol biopolymer transport system component